MTKTTRKKYTKKEYDYFIEEFMGSVDRLGLSEWAYNFSRINDEFTMACTNCCMEQMSATIKFAEYYDIGKGAKGIREDIRDSAQHEALEVLFWPLRMRACEGLGDAIWKEVDGKVHTLINRVQYLIFK